MKKNFITTIIFSLLSVIFVYGQDTSIVKELDVLKSRLKQNEKDFDTKTTQKFEDLNSIKSQIGVILGKERISNEEIKELTVLHNRRTLVEDDLIFKTRDNAVTTLEQRYETGNEVLSKVLVQLLYLKSKYKDIKLYQSYANMANPMQYSDFIGNLGEIEKKLSRKKFAVTLPAPLNEVINKNPTIATGYSLVTTILSNIDVTDKSQKFKTIRDILTLTSSMQGDLNQLNSEIIYLDSRVESFLQKCEKFFTEYNKVIGYNKSYSEYISSNDKQVLASLQALTFKSIHDEIEKNKSNTLFMMSQTDKEIEVTFNLLRLVDLIDEHKSILAETMNYYDKFQNILGKYSSDDYPELKVDAKMQDGKTFKQALTKIVEELTSAKSAASTAYQASDVSNYEIRKILYGKPTP